MRRAGIKGSDVEHVMTGCVSQVGSQSGNVGRMIVLASKVLPVTVPATTLDMQVSGGLHLVVDQSPPPPTHINPQTSAALASARSRCARRRSCRGRWTS